MTTPPATSDPPPPGTACRPLCRADLTATFEVYAAAERAATGRLAIEQADIEGDWARPGFDVASDSVGVLADGVLVGAAEVFRGQRAEGAVLPSHGGRGIGSWLAAWTEARARELGSPHLGQVQPAGSDGERLLRGRGYTSDYEAWVFELPTGHRVPGVPLPQGYSLRTLGEAPGEGRSGEASLDEERTAYTLIEDAFGEWTGRHPKTFDDWAATATRRPGFAPWQVRFAVAAGGAAVGVCLTVLDSQGTAFVDQLAVRRDHRGMGLGRVLLADGFARGHEHGATAYELATDSRTGARGLYESVGMRVRETWVHLGIDLG